MGWHNSHGSPYPSSLSRIFWATQMQIPALKSFRLIKEFVAFFSPSFFPFSAPWILNRDLLMSNKHKNASLSSFAAKARMIIKLNPGHMAWVLLLETSPGSGIEGGINPWQENRENKENRAVPHSSLCQRGRNSCPQCHRGVGHTQDCHIPSAWRNCLWKHIPSIGQGVGRREGGREGGSRGTEAGKALGN